MQDPSKGVLHWSCSCMRSTEVSPDSDECTSPFSLFPWELLPGCGIRELAQVCQKVVKLVLAQFVSELDHKML